MTDTYGVEFGETSLPGVVNLVNPAVTGTLTAAIIDLGTPTIDGDVLDGTILSKVKVLPGATATTAGANYHKLFAIGDTTGTTAYGFGDPAKPTTGIFGSFGRTVATSAGVTDTGLDIRVINKLVNVGANNLQGAYIKAKNYTGGTVGGNLIGLFVEVVNDGTLSGAAYGLKIGNDNAGDTLTGDVLLSNGLAIFASKVAITADSTLTSLPAGSIGVTSHATGVGKLFVSDGSKWQYASVSS